MLDLGSTRMYRCLFPPLLPESRTTPRLYFHCLLESRAYERLSFSHRYMQGPSTRLLCLSSLNYFNYVYPILGVIHVYFTTIIYQGLPSLEVIHVYVSTIYTRVFHYVCSAHVYITSTFTPVEKLSTSVLPQCLFKSRSYPRLCYQRVYPSREVTNVSSTQVEMLSTSMSPLCLLERGSYPRLCLQRFYSSRKVISVLSTPVEKL